METMTFVEFFSDEALENVMCLLQYHPARVLYIGYKATMLTRKMESLRDFAFRVSPKSELSFIEVPRDSLEECVRTISDISDEYPDAYYELTGGGEMILIAFGVVSARKKLRTLRIDPYTGTEIRMDLAGPGGTLPLQKQDDLHMTVQENIILHGGALTPQTGSLSTWKFTDDFKRDIRDIWAIACSFKHRWNHSTAILEDVLKGNPCDETGLYSISRSSLGDAVTLLQALAEAGKLKDFHPRQRRVDFRFKNASIRRIVTKTGNILELHVYEVASRRPDIFNDQVIGAVIDWNSSKSPAEKKKLAEDYEKYMSGTLDTQNEIDVILMRSVIPTFISCKSGKAGSNALHELQTVTHRFGGKYAKKALVMAMPCDASRNGISFFRQRAKEMHIWLIDNVYEMPDERLLKKLIRIQGN